MKSRSALEIIVNVGTSADRRRGSSADTGQDNLVLVGTSNTGVPRKLGRRRKPVRLLPPNLGAARWAKERGSGFPNAEGKCVSPEERRASFMASLR